MLGMLIGAATLGNIADAYTTNSAIASIELAPLPFLFYRIGRQLAFTLNIFLLSIVTTGLAFSPNLPIFCVLRFLSGVSGIGHFLILFVWGKFFFNSFCRILYLLPQP